MELALLDAALRADLPVLAVCRGMQVLNVHLGGDLVQQLPDLVGSNDHQPRPGAFGASRWSPNRGAPSAVCSVSGIEVLCCHHQAVGTLGRDLVVTARSGDGVIEAVELPGHRFVVGVQWHPEETGDRRLFEALVEAAGAGRRSRATAGQTERGTCMSDTTTVVNPATETAIAELPLAGVEEADRAVARALGAGRRWRSVAPADRARLLRRFAAQVEEHGEELARLETSNVGKPIAESRDEVAMVAEVLYFYAGAVDKHRGATVPVAGGVDMTFHEPLGRGGRHRAVELPHRHHLVEDRSRPGHRQHHRGQTGRDHPAVRAPPGRAGPRGRTSPKACSRWWWGRARRWAPGWSSTPMWPRWPSPVRPRSVAR